MDTVSIADAKNRLSELVRRVEAGEKIVLTRRGEPIAHLTAAKKKNGQSQAKHVAQTFDALALLRAGTTLEGDPRAAAREGLD